MTHDDGAETAKPRWVHNAETYFRRGLLKKKKSVAHVVGAETAHSRLDALMMRKLILGRVPQSQKGNKKGQSPWLDKTKQHTHSRW